jgi:glycosyltransferase involved in cell wall biosynthesis
MNKSMTHMPHQDLSQAPPRAEQRPSAAILLAGPYPPPFGGPGVHMMHLRRQLEARGAVCEALNIGERRREAIPDVTPVRSGLGFAFQIVRFARRGFHIHHLFNVESHKAIVLAAMAAALARTFQTTYSIGFIGGARQKYLDSGNPLWTRLLRLPLRAAAFVICNNDSVKQVLAKLCSTRTPIHSIQSFFADQVSEIGELPTAIREFAESHSPVLSTVTAARLETGDPYHELETLIRAMQEVRKTHKRIGSIVIGGGRERLERPYRQLIADAGLQDHFLLAFELPHHTCLAAIRSSDIFVRAYVKDGNSSSVREALALGIPTVAVANPNHPESVISFARNDGEGLAHTLLDALGRLDELRERFGSGLIDEGGSIAEELDLLLNVKPK